MGQAMQRATEALLQADLMLAEKVIADHAAIVARAAHIREATFKLLAVQAPVTGDLRAVVSTLRNVADVALLGDPHRAAQLDDNDDAMDHLYRHLFGLRARLPGAREIVCG